MLSQTEIITVIQDAIYTVLITAAPMLVIGLVVGLIVSVMQATTQIHEQTLAFVPKIVSIFAALLIFGGFMLTNLTEFTQRIFSYMTTMGMNPH